MDKTVFQKQYDFELEQRNAIASSTNTPVVSITVIGSALSSMVLTFPYSTDIVTSIFLALVVFAAVASIVALIFIFKSIIGYTYEKIPTASALAAHHEALNKWHFENGTELVHIASEVENDFDVYLESRLSEASERNGNNNIRRGNYIHDATVSIAVALAFMVLCAPFFIYAKSINKESSYRVEIVKPISLRELNKMAEIENGSNSGSPSASSTPQQPAASPVQKPAVPAQTTQPKPSGPPNLVFKGSVTHVARTLDTPNGLTTGNNRNKE